MPRRVSGRTRLLPATWCASTVGSAHEREVENALEPSATTKGTNTDTVITVRFFGVLRDIRVAAGLPTTTDCAVPADGSSARVLAVDLGLDPALIEGVFINRTVYALDSIVRPGDRVAFVPYGTPGPHRLFLGLYHAGRAGSEGDAPT